MVRWKRQTALRTFQDNLIRTIIEKSQGNLGFQHLHQVIAEGECVGVRRGRHRTVVDGKIQRKPLELSVGWEPQPGLRTLGSAGQLDMSPG